MIVVVSTSSPVASLAAFRGDELVFERAEEARHRASEAILGWFETLREGQSGGFTGFVADTGPGGFTGTRVGIVVAKTLAYALGTRCAGISAFDLIALGKAAIPARRGSYLTREGTVEGWPDGAVGYGPDAPESLYPLASRAKRCLADLTWMSPEALLPDYRLEPSISTPKKPYRTDEAHARVG